MTDEKLSFEDKLKNLEDIVKKLEGTDVSLDDAIKFFEKGKKLTNELEEEIKSAELKIKKAIDKE